MREQTVAMYCLLNDLLTLTLPLLADPRRRLTGAQVLTTALVAARFFSGNLTLGRHYMEQHWGQNRLDKSGFIRHLHALTDTQSTPAFRSAFDISPQVLVKEIVPRIARKAYVRVIDLYTPLLGQATLFPDGVHPLDAVNALLAQVVYQAIK